MILGPPGEICFWSRNRENNYRSVRMNFFKCLSQNVSIISEQQENSTKRRWKLTLKKKKKIPATNDKLVTPSSKGQGLSLLPGIPHELTSPNVPEPVEEDSKFDIVGDLPQRDPLPPKPVYVKNNLRKNRIAMFRRQKYFDNMAACSHGTIAHGLSPVGSETMRNHLACADYPLDKGKDIISVSMEEDNTDVDVETISDTNVDVETISDTVINVETISNTDVDVETISDTDVDVKTLSDKLSSTGSVYLGANLLFKVAVIRGVNGLGFSFGGKCPPRITKVERDSSAEQAGIRKGDLMIKINGCELSQTTSEKVADYIKTKKPKYMILELKRDLYQPAEVCAEHRFKSCKELMAGVSDDNLSTVEDERGAAAGADAQNDDGRTDQRATYYLQDMHKQATGISKPSVRASAKHIQELYNLLREVLGVTPKCCPDFDNVQMTIDQLSHLTKIMMKACSVNRNQDVASSQNNLNPQTSDKIQMAYLMNIQLAESTKSINIIDIQDVLIFASGLQDGHSCVENMPLIYEGNVHKCNKKGSWITYKLLLFSELILVASEDFDGFLFVSDSPILIEDLAGLDINREHESEFSLHLRTAATEVSQKQPSECPYEESCSIVTFRASSAQGKFLWKSLLEKRVAAVTGSSLHCVIPTKPV